MPSNTLRAGKRFNPITLKFWRKFRRERGIDIDYKTFQKIIWTHNQIMMDCAANEEAGIELPERLGHIVVTKFKSKNINRPIDWVNTKKVGKIIPLLNLHSFGFMFHIRWFKMVTIFKNRRIYRFEPYRLFKRAVAANAKAGKKYFKWDDSDFWSESRMIRSFSKFYKQDTTNGTNHA